MYLSIVIPAYNEEKRIKDSIERIASYLAIKGYEGELIVVDDGSTDRTREILDEVSSHIPSLRILAHKSNMGKGYSIQKGILAAKGDFIFFSDADLSTPIEELGKLVEYLKEGYHIVIGSRALPHSLILLHQPWYREIMGKFFNLLVRWLVLGGIRDTQCGFKGFIREAALEIFSRQKLHGFSFDVEVLYMARKLNYRIMEVPVRWINSPHTKVHIIKDSLKMFRDLLRVKFDRRPLTIDKKLTTDYGLRTTDIFQPIYAITAFYFLMMLAVNPFVEGPIIDDWTYAWSVENLLNTGKLRILDWSIHYPIFQILWGTIFSLPFGFSFSALRLSTIILAWIGTLAFYRTLRELGFDKMSSLLGALLLPLNPVYFVLTYSFMTDVPFISMMNLAILFYVLAIKRKSYGFIWLGGISSLASFLIRQLSITIPLAFLIYFVLNRANFNSRKGLTGFNLRFIVPIIFPFIGFALLFLWIEASFGITSPYSRKVEALSYFFSVPVWKYFGYILRMGLHLSLILSPLTLSWLLIPPYPLLKKGNPPLPLFNSPSRPFSKGGKGGFLVSLALVLSFDLMYLFFFQGFPLAIGEKGATLSLTGLGAARPLISGEIQDCFFPCFWFKATTILISQISLAIMLLALFQAIKGFMHIMSKSVGEKAEPVILSEAKNLNVAGFMRSFAEFILSGVEGLRMTRWRLSHTPSKDAPQGHEGLPTKFLVYSNGLFQFGLINLLWLYYDRYYLVLFPCLIPLVLELLTAKGERPKVKGQRGLHLTPSTLYLVTMVGLVIFALISTTGTRDNLSFAKATWEGVNWLRDKGVPVHEIDGGYALNGWLLYAHPENLPLGALPQKDITWVTTRKKLPYVISNSILPGYKVIKKNSWKSSPWMTASIYVLQEDDVKNSAKY